MEALLLPIITDWAAKTNPMALGQNVVIFFVAFYLVNRAFGKHFKAIEGKFDALTAAVTRIEKSVHEGFDSGDARMHKIENRVNTLEQRKSS